MYILYSQLNRTNLAFSGAESCLKAWIERDLNASAFLNSSKCDLQDHPLSKSLKYRLQLRNYKLISGKLMSCLLMKIFQRKNRDGGRRVGFWKARVKLACIKFKLFVYDSINLVFWMTDGNLNPWWMQVSRGSMTVSANFSRFKQTLPLSFGMRGSL